MLLWNKYINVELTLLLKQTFLAQNINQKIHKNVTKAPFKIASPYSAFCFLGHSNCASWSSWRAIPRGSRSAERSWSSVDEDLVPGTISVFCRDTGFALAGRTPLSPSAWGLQPTLSLLSHNIKLRISKFQCAEKQEASWVPYSKYLTFCSWEVLLWEEVNL